MSKTTKPSAAAWRAAEKICDNGYGLGRAYIENAARVIDSQTGLPELPAAIKAAYMEGIEDALDNSRWGELAVSEYEDLWLSSDACAKVEATPKAKDAR